MLALHLQSPWARNAKKIDFLSVSILRSDYKRKTWKVQISSNVGKEELYIYDVSLGILGA